MGDSAGQSGRVDGSGAIVGGDELSEIRVERAAGVVSIVLAAPARRNAFVPEMVGDLLDACADIDSDPSVGAVVIKAEGDSFCAGAHRAVLTNEGMDSASPESYSNLRTLYSAFGRIREQKSPTSAAVRGHADGAGVNLKLATDLRIVATGARIITGFMNIGIHPGGGHFALLSRVAGREAAAAMSVFGQEVSGARAAEIGLAWEALAEGLVEPRAVELAQAVARDPELARTVVRSFRMSTG